MQPLAYVVAALLLATFTFLLGLLVRRRPQVPVEFELAWNRALDLLPEGIRTSPEWRRVYWLMNQHGIEP
jgi:hypothetical protein